VRSGRTQAQAAGDFTAKVDARGLKPGRDYWHWFEAEGGLRSPVGRFRTLPKGETSEVVLAAVSCQL
jgi:alkaline phosphatase D